MAQRTRRYLIRRVTVVLLTLFVVTLLSFLLMRLSPVDPATAYVKRNSAVVTQEQIDEARVILGLDKPLPVQYFDWVVDALHMDFGISLGTGNPVTEELAKTVPVTLTVVAYSAVIMSLGVLGVGMLGYLWRQKAGGMILSFLTMIGISVPGFYLGTAFIDLFAVRLGWISVSGNSGFARYFPVALCLSVLGICFYILGKEHRIIRAHDGMEVVTMFDEVKPDLILMDIKMPNLDGLEATKIIRELSATVPIIAQSAFAYEQDRKAAKEAGCNDFIAKPIADDKLKAMIHKWLSPP